MRIITEVSAETMQKIDAHCSATKSSREAFATAAIAAAVDKIKPAKAVETEKVDEKAK